MSATATPINLFTAELMFTHACKAFKMSDDDSVDTAIDTGLDLYRAGKSYPDLWDIAGELIVDDTDFQFLMDTIIDILDGTGELRSEDKGCVVEYENPYASAH